MFAAKDTEDSKVKSRRICSNCANFEVCGFIKNKEMPVLECELYDDENESS